MAYCKNCGHESHCGVPLMKEFRGHKDHGGIDLVVERKYLNSTIGTLLNVLLKKTEAQVKNESSNVTIDQSLQSAS